MSGTTKTGKALEKALEVFDERFGARRGQSDVAQVYDNLACLLFTCLVYKFRSLSQIST